MPYLSTKADKGGAVVIWDTQDYIKEAERQLGDCLSYKKLDTNPIEENTNEIRSTINNLKSEKMIEENLATSLIPEVIKTPRFYMLPKVHKTNNPGRPSHNLADVQPCNH